MKILLGDRRVSAGLRRQRVEHVRAGARACVPGTMRSRSCSRGPGAPAAASGEASYDGFRVLEFGARGAGRCPYVRNYFKSERLYGRARRRS